MGVPSGSLIVYLDPYILSYVNQPRAFARSERVHQVEPSMSARERRIVYETYAQGTKERKTLDTSTDLTSFLRDACEAFVEHQSRAY